jgi:RNA recognition motif-containing protein
MGQKLFVGGIAVATTDEGLRQLFARCGTVLSANVVLDEFTGQSRGFAFVEMATAEEAQKAVTDLKWHELDGRRLNVDIARPQTNVIR